MDYLILERRPDLELICKQKKKEKKKSTCCIVDFALPDDNRVEMIESESEKIYKHLDLARKLRKLWNMRVAVILIVIGEFETAPKGLEKDTGGIGNQRKNRDHPDYNIVKISLNTEKSLGDRKRLAAP